MRTMFMAPSNRFWMRDGIVNMLAGNLRGNLRSVIPITCFKVAFHVLSALHRRGLGGDLPEKPPKMSRT
jgi:hypothetical protein